MEKIFDKNYSVVFLHAHPDDEAFLSAGLINEFSVKSKKCVVVYTAASLVNGEKNTKTRQREAKESCRLLGASSVIFLDYCEPQYDKKDCQPMIGASIPKISEEIYKKLKHKKIEPPYIIFSYDKNGGYGNQDHKKLNLVGRHFQKKYKKEIEMFGEVTINRDKFKKWIKQASTKLAENQIPKLEYWSKNFGLKPSDINFKYSLTKNQFKLKEKSLAVNKSQMSYGDFPLSLPREDFNYLFGEEFIKFY